MSEYHKIQTVYKRDMSKPGNPIIDGDYSLPEFAFLAGNEWVWTEKVDGTNMRVMFDAGHVTFGGKTDNAQIPVPLLNRMTATFQPLADRLAEIFPDGGAILYGEGYGGKIQKGSCYRPDQDFVLFDVRVGRWWLQRADVEDVAAKLGIDIVPVVGRGTIPEMVDFVRAGFRSTWGDFFAEGIVARPATELCTRSGQRLIVKVKHRDFA